MLIHADDRKLIVVSAEQILGEIKPGVLKEARELVDRYFLVYSVKQ